MDNDALRSDLNGDAGERESGFGWGWFVVLGVLLAVLGGVAYLDRHAAAGTSLAVVGVLMIVAAVAQLATRLLVPGWRGTGFLVLSGVFYGTGGVVLVASGGGASEGPAAALAAALILSGVTRVRLSAVMPLLPGWGWITASGLVTAAAGFALLHFLLLRPAWPIGATLAFDLAFQGAAIVAFGLALKAGARRQSEAAS